MSRWLYVLFIFTGAAFVLAWFHVPAHPHEVLFLQDKQGVCYTCSDSSHESFLLKKQWTRLCSMSISRKQCNMLTMSSLRTEPIWQDSWLQGCLGKPTD